MYDYFCKNVKFLEKSIKTVESDIKRYIDFGLIEKEYLYTRFLSYLVKCWCSAWILKLLYQKEQTIKTKDGFVTLKEPFTQSERDFILGQPSLKEKFINLLNISITKRYRSIDNFVIKLNASGQTKLKYSDLLEFINNYFDSALDDNPILINGQWLFEFTNDFKHLKIEIPDSNELIKERLKKENVLNIGFQLAIFKALFQIFFDLAVSPKTFERDNFKYLQQIKANTKNIEKRDYDKFKLNRESNFKITQQIRQDNVVKDLFKEEYKEYELALNEKLKVEFERRLQTEIENIKSQYEKSIILLVEGPSDKIIIENAWLKLFPQNADLPFAIMSVGGKMVLNTLLKEGIQFDKHPDRLYIGLWDFDEAFNEWNGLWNKNSDEIVTDETKGLTKKHKRFKAYAMLLPIPLHRRNIASRNFKGESLLSIELLFSDLIMINSGFSENISKIGNLSVIKIKDNKKNEFAANTVSFNISDFLEFRNLFENILNIMNTHNIRHTGNVGFL